MRMLCFLYLWVLTCAVSALAQGQGSENFTDSVRPLDHHPMARAIQGQRYEALVPDTLDYAKLEKRIALLEKALELVMATQTKMIKEDK